MEMEKRLTLRTESPDSPQISGMSEIDFARTSRYATSEGNGGIGLTRARILWAQRQFLYRVMLYALIASVLIAFLIPKRYSSTTRLMPPDEQSGSGLSSISGLAAAAAAMTGAGRLGAVAGDLLGLKSTSDTFVGILGSRTAEDAVIRQFDLQKVYGDRRIEDARTELEAHTTVEV